jgi:hypothetical protein
MSCVIVLVGDQVNISVALQSYLRCILIDSQVLVSSLGINGAIQSVLSTLVLEIEHESMVEQ